jgi:4'-phosphopantetheinyl transferase
VRLDRPSDRIARRVLAPADLRRLASESPEERPEAFYRCWTAAEAYAKATGRGLPALIGAAAPAELIGAAPPPEHAGWSLLALDPADGYVASLVVEGSEPSVRVAEWALPARAANDA